ncbi:reverse transcriptase [Senna tora]|uniref:Reverse transcriptase n=1 Tax=Senna tora TaxID=362788 RepID=A0A834WWW3_9FABA|nr:reverse transcriptase [Senna tora]
MGDLISPNQSAFIKGRNIADNILVAAEPLNYINKIKSFWGAWKIDLRKAYDKISWHFLEETLRMMDFPDHWISILMQCITTPTLRLQEVGTIKGIKVARQAPMVNHLIYADDSVMFFKADLESCNHLFSTVSKFGDISGLKLNQSKCEELNLAPILLTDLPK